MSGRQQHWLALVGAAWIVLVGASLIVGGQVGTQLTNVSSSFMALVAFYEAYYLGSHHHRNGKDDQ